MRWEHSEGHASGPRRTLHRRHRLWAHAAEGHLQTAGGLHALDAAHTAGGSWCRRQLSWTFLSASHLARCPSPAAETLPKPALTGKQRYGASGTQKAGMPPSLGAR